MDFSSSFFRALNQSNFHADDALTALSKDRQLRKMFKQPSIEMELFPKEDNTSLLSSEKALKEVLKLVKNYPDNLRKLSPAAIANLRTFTRVQATYAKEHASGGILQLFRKSPDALQSKVETQIDQVRFTFLLQKVKDQPDNVNEAEKSELASIICKILPRLKKAEKQLLISQLAQPQILNILATPSDKETKRALITLSREAYNNGVLYQLFAHMTQGEEHGKTVLKIGTTTLSPDAEAAIVDGIKEAMQKALKPTLLKKFKPGAEELHIPLDPQRTDAAISKTAQWQVSLFIAQAACTVIGQKMGHESYSEVANDALFLAELQMSRRLYYAEGKACSISIPKTCKANSERLQKSILQEIGRLNACIEQVKNPERPEKIYTDIEKQLKIVESLIKSAEASPVSYQVHDLLGLWAKNSRGLENSIYQPSRIRFQKGLSWIRASFNTRAKANDTQTTITRMNLNEAATLLQKGLTSKNLDRLELLIKDLSSHIATPELMHAVLDDLATNVVVSSKINRLKEQLALCKDPHADIAQFEKLQAEVYQLLTLHDTFLNSWLNEPEHNIVKQFLKIYELRVT